MTACHLPPDDALPALDFHPSRYFPFGGWGDDGISSAPSQQSCDPCNHGEFVVHYLPFGGVCPAISAGQVRHERLLAQQQQDTNSQQARHAATESIIHISASATSAGRALSVGK